MFNKIRTIGLYVVLVLQCPSAWAAGLTLDDAIRAALQDNQELQAARQSIDVAQARAVQSGLWPNPRLEIGRTTDAPFRNQGESSTSISVSQDLPVTGRLAKQKAVASVDVALALAEVDDAERRLAGEVAEAFYGLVSVGKQIEVRERLIAIDQQLVVVTRDRFAAAEVSEIDANTASLDLQRLVQERSGLEASRAALTAALNRLLSRPADAPVRLDDSLPAAVAMPPLADLQQTALERRADLRAALLAVDRFDAERVLASASRWEDWTLSLGQQRDRLVVDGAPPQDADMALTLNLAVPIPLFNRNQGSVAAARDGAMQATTSAGALRFRIESEVASAYQEAQRLEGALLGYTERLLPLSERNVMLAHQAYRQGQIAIMEIVLVQRQHSDFNLAYLETLDRYLKARARLTTAIDGYRSRSAPTDAAPAATTGH